ncbi:PepSY-like domain-containing protein [Brachyspira sp.]|uniref:PepSY-like domain-containing protein n=1 Tax=Brachyspira sp. TaxID=1977261 RepID=UPI003D7E8293
MTKRFICVLAVLTVMGSASLFADWYIPLDQVPAAVITTAKQTYPQAEVWAVKMEHYNVYEVKMSNMMELYIDINGNLLGQDFDD